jgi:single-strand DNA-binding protein
MLNKIIIQGRLTRDPYPRRTGSGLAVASFSVAVERDYPSKDTGEKEVDFINCVAWREKGEFVSKYFTKGSMIVVSGRLQMRNWTDDNGNKRIIAEIVAEEVYFGESKKKDSDEGAVAVGDQYGNYAPIPPRFNTTPSYTTPNPYYTHPGSPTTSIDNFTMFDDDDAVLPF